MGFFRIRDTSRYQGKLGINIFKEIAKSMYFNMYIL